MCDVVMVSMAIAATSTAVQGGDFGDVVKSAAIAGATAYVGGELFAVGAEGAKAGYLVGSEWYQIAEGVSAMSIGTTAVGASQYSAMMMTPQTPDYSQFGYGAQPYEPQGYSSQHATVTGSGGRQAAAVLASEIKQAKSLRKRQAEVADYGLGMAVAGTGLQIA